MFGLLPPLFETEWDRFCIPVTRLCRIESRPRIDSDAARMIRLA
jgi:hypothetical protein